MQLVPDLLVAVMERSFCIFWDSYWLLAKRSEGAECKGICHLFLSLQECKESTVGPAYSGQVAQWASSPRKAYSLKAYPALFRQMASWWILNFFMLLLILLVSVMFALIQGMTMEQSSLCGRSSWVHHPWCGAPRSEHCPGALFVME